MFCNRFGLQTHILAKFINGNNLVLFFLEVFFNPFNEVSAVPIAFACDYLNVFRINTQSFHISNISYCIHTSDKEYL